MRSKTCSGHVQAIVNRYHTKNIPLNQVGDIQNTHSAHTPMSPLRKYSTSHGVWSCRCYNNQNLFEHLIRDTRAGHVKYTVLLTGSMLLWPAHKQCPCRRPSNALYAVCHNADSPNPSKPMPLLLLATSQRLPSQFLSQTIRPIPPRQFEFVSLMASERVEFSLTAATRLARCSVAGS